MRIGQLTTDTDNSMDKTFRDSLKNLSSEIDGIAKKQMDFQNGIQPIEVEFKGFNDIGHYLFEWKTRGVTVRSGYDPSDARFYEKAINQCIEMDRKPEYREKRLAIRKAAQDKAALTPVDEAII